MRYPCQVRVSAGGLRALPELIPGDALRQQLTAAGPPDAHGFMRLALRLENEQVAAGQLIALGDDVELLEPVALRARVRGLAQRMAARHA